MKMASGGVEESKDEEHWDDASKAPSDRIGLEVDQETQKEAKQDKSTRTRHPRQTEEGNVAMHRLVFQIGIKLLLNCYVNTDLRAPSC